MLKKVYGLAEFDPTNYVTLPTLDISAADVIVWLSVDEGTVAGPQHIIGDYAANLGWRLTRTADTQVAAVPVANFTFTAGVVTPGEDTLDLNIPQTMWGRPLPIIMGVAGGDIHLGIAANTTYAAALTAAFAPNNGTISMGYDVNNGANPLGGITVYGAAYGGKTGLLGTLQAQEPWIPEAVGNQSLWSFHRTFMTKNYTPNTPIASPSLVVPEIERGTTPLGNATIFSDGASVPAARAMTP